MARRNRGSRCALPPYGKKTYLLSLRRQMNTAFRILAGLRRIKRRAGEILSASFICLRAKPAQRDGFWAWSGSPGGDPPGLDWVAGPNTRLPFWLEPGLLRCQRRGPGLSL